MEYFWDGTCHRCGKKTNCHIMSKFNMDLICMQCKKKEREHPAFAEADRLEVESVRRGEYNFPGVGKPRDL